MVSLDSQQLQQLPTCLSPRDRDNDKWKRIAEQMDGWTDLLLGRTFF